LTIQVIHVFFYQGQMS